MPVTMCPGCGATVDVDPCSHCGPLPDLVRATQELREANARWQAQLKSAIADGRHSERVIGQAAGISGPAVHARKRLAAALGDSHQPGNGSEPS